MSGTRRGGKAAAITNKERYGKDFYARIGAQGGKNGRTGGFYSARCRCNYSDFEHKKAECAGHKGGQISRRTK